MANTVRDSIRLRCHDDHAVARATRRVCTGRPLGGRIAQIRPGMEQYVREVALRGQSHGRAPGQGVPLEAVGMRDREAEQPAPESLPHRSDEAITSVASDAAEQESSRSAIRVQDFRSSRHRVPYPRGWGYDGEGEPAHHARDLLTIRRASVWTGPAPGEEEAGIQMWYFASDETIRPRGKNGRVAIVAARRALDLGCNTDMRGVVERASGMSPDEFMRTIS